MVFHIWEWSVCAGCPPDQCLIQLFLFQWINLRPFFLHKVQYRALLWLFSPFCLQSFHLPQLFLCLQVTLKLLNSWIVFVFDLQVAQHIWGGVCSAYKVLTQNAPSALLFFPKKGPGTWFHRDRPCWSIEPIVIVALLFCIIVVSTFLFIFCIQQIMQLVSLTSLPSPFTSLSNPLHLITPNLISPSHLPSLQLLFITKPIGITFKANVQVKSRHCCKLSAETVLLRNCILSQISSKLRMKNAHLDFETNQSPHKDKNINSYSVNITNCQFSQEQSTTIDVYTVSVH